MTGKSYLLISTRQYYLNREKNQEKKNERNPQSAYSLYGLPSARSAACSQFQHDRGVVLR